MLLTFTAHPCTTLVKKNKKLLKKWNITDKSKVPSPKKSLFLVSCLHMSTNRNCYYFYLICTQLMHRCLISNGATRSWLDLTHGPQKQSLPRLLGSLGASRGSGKWERPPRPTDRGQQEATQPWLQEGGEHEARGRALRTPAGHRLQSWRDSWKPNPHWPNPFLLCTPAQTTKL